MEQQRPADTSSRARRSLTTCWSASCANGLMRLCKLTIYVTIVDSLGGTETLEKSAQMTLLGQLGEFTPSAD